MLFRSDSEKSPLDEIMEASAMTLTEARNYLGRFLFTGDDVFKRNSTLSGGERSRLALARLGLDAGNFLVLDEPTNHLDIRGVEELEVALGEFPGTLLVVSHDRYFVSRVTRKVLDVRDGTVKFYKVPYEEYLQEREKEKVEITAPRVSEKRHKQEEEKQRREEEAAKRKERRLREKLIHSLEEEIGSLEGRLAEVEKELSDPVIFDDYKRAGEKAQEMETLKEKLDELYASWDEISQCLEE